MILYITENNIEVIDNTLEAEDRLSAMEYAEEKLKRELHRKRKKLARNPFYKLAVMCGAITL